MTPEMEMKTWIFIRRGRCPQRFSPGEGAEREVCVCEGGGGAAVRATPDDGEVDWLRFQALDFVEGL